MSEAAQEAKPVQAKPSPGVPDGDRQEAGQPHVLPRDARAGEKAAPIDVQLGNNVTPGAEPAPEKPGYEQTAPGRHSEAEVPAKQSPRVPDRDRQEAGEPRVPTKDARAGEKAAPIDVQIQNNVTRGAEQTPENPGYEQTAPGRHSEAEVPAKPSHGFPDGDRQEAGEPCVPPSKDARAGEKAAPIGVQIQNNVTPGAEQTPENPGYEQTAPGRHSEAEIAVESILDNRDDDKQPARLKDFVIDITRLEIQRTEETTAPKARSGDENAVHSATGSRSEDDQTAESEPEALPEDEQQGNTESFKIIVKITTTGIEISKRLINSVKGAAVPAYSLGMMFGFPPYAAFIVFVIYGVFEKKENDPEIRDIVTGCLQFELHCFTEDVFLEILSDYESGKIKERLKEEFLNVGIKTKGLQINIQNSEEVERTKTVIVRRRSTSLAKTESEVKATKKQDLPVGETRKLSTEKEPGFPEATLDKSKAKENFTRIFHLLLGKGGDALRAVLHAIHPPSTLAAVLNANKVILQKIKVINSSQWNILYPASGAAPDSNNFSIILLTILLRNICGLSPPITGWNKMPPAGDVSQSADIVRIRHFRNEAVAHKANDQLDDATFHCLWQEISQPLARLGVHQQDIDEIKKGPLSSEGFNDAMINFSIANLGRVSRLLIDKGSVALRNVLHNIHPPSTLAAVLNANKVTLTKAKAINCSQWNLLFPASGAAPDSNNFDITLLTTLLRNICRLPPPARGWNRMPPAVDTSLSADIGRIKMFRNEVFSHITSTQMDDATFEELWKEISGPLIRLGVPEKDIDEIKYGQLRAGFQVNTYAEDMMKWVETLEMDVKATMPDEL